MKNKPGKERAERRGLGMNGREISPTTELTLSKSQGMMIDKRRCYGGRRKRAKR